jgi:hypothetical protein
VTTPVPGQRKLGAAVLVVLAAAIVLAQLARGRREGGQSLEAAYAELALVVDGPPADRQVHVQQAERKLTRAAGAVIVDAEAIAALAILESLAVHAGELAPPPPSLDHDGQDTAVAYTAGLLERGRTREALEWLASPPVQRHFTRSLATLQRVATQWQQARTARKP